jgi:hypothetical protein
MIQAAITIDDDVLEALQDAMGQAPKLTQTLFRRRVRIRRQQLKQRVNKTVPQPDLPCIWSFDPVADARARGWYFANIVPKGSKGGRYQRQGKIEAGWDFIEEQQGGATIIRLENDAEGAEFVVGARQVPSHADSGHPQIDDLAREFSAFMVDDAIETWYTVIDPFAGARG